MRDSQQADAIVQEMMRLRTELDDEIDQLREGARALANWRYYVSAHPWATLAAAVAMGYWLVPRPVRIPRPDPEALAQLAKENRLVIASRPEARSRGLAGALLTLAANTALRAGMAYAGQHLGARQAPQSHEEPAHATPSDPFFQ